MKLDHAVSASLCVLVVTLPACGSGSGGEFTETERTVLTTCDDCHDPGGFESFVTDVRALDDALFTAERFPDDMFNVDLVELSVEDLRTNANPPRDGDLDEGMPVRKAWILHELHTLELQLEDDPPSDFTSQESFDAYIVGGGEIPMGCETMDRLDLAEYGSASQMPPLWTQPLFDALGREFIPLDEANRAALRSYVETGLPSGPASCY